MIASFFVYREYPKYSENHIKKVSDSVSKFWDIQLTRMNVNI
ncbi:hypothetical protein HDE70_002181 [Pedobacter cryoconitis]|nr:hypothetical protein [Pedobacter cryoconitis]